MKRILFIALISALTVTSQAQSTNILYGLKAGMNMSVLSGQHGGSSHNLNAWYAGAQFTLPFSKIFSFQPELIYSREGFRAPGTIYHFDFARLPLAFQLRHESGLYAELGAQFGVKLKSEVTYITSDDKLDIPDMETFNTGVFMGLGYRHSSGLGANLRFAPSVSNVGNEVDDKLTTLSFGLFYSLGARR